MRFAYAQHKSAIDETVFAWIEQMNAADSEVHALLDGSMLSARDLNYLEHHGLDFQPALAGSPFDSYELKGPLIQRLDVSRADHQHALLRRTDGIPGLSFIATQKPRTELCERLIWLAKVDTDDGQSLHCRFADTRVLPGLLALLKPEQHNSLAAVMTEWAWVTRDAKLKSQPIRVVEARERIMDGEPFRFDNKQFDALLTEAEPDMVFQMLVDEMPDALPDSPSHAIHQRLVRLLDAAHHHSILDLPDLFQYAVVGLATCDDFDLHPEIQDTWQQISNEGKRFRDLVMHWPDDVWEKLRISSVTL
jgi:Domain of unknown function (DUF4123)